jgi:hypothetical protein
LLTVLLPFQPPFCHYCGTLTTQSCAAIGEEEKFLTDKFNANKHKFYYVNGWRGGKETGRGQLARWSAEREARWEGGFKKN